MMKNILNEFEMHHIGIATRGIEKEFPFYSILGYHQEGVQFDDDSQGISGLFIVGSGLPRLELLENLNDSSTLDRFLKTNNKMYHIAYYVEDIEKALVFLKKNRAIVVSPLKKSVYFKKRICFLLLPNMQMIELLEK